MDILDKLDLMIDTTVAADVATNTGQGKIDVIGGECPKGMSYDKINKVCVPSKNEGYVYVYNKKKDKRVRISDDPKLIAKYEKMSFIVESSVSGGSYVSGTTVNIIGSAQTRVWGDERRRNIFDLARKEPVETEMEDPTDTNILGRKALKFDKESGAYVPSIWGDDG